MFLVFFSFYTGRRFFSLSVGGVMCKCWKTWGGTYSFRNWLVEKMLGILIIAPSFKCYLNKLFNGCLALCTYIPCHVREERRRLQQSVYQMTSVWPWLNCFLAHQCSQCQSLRFRVPENNINVYFQTYCKGSPLIWTIFSKSGIIFIVNDLDWPRNIGQSFWPSFTDVKN